MPSLSPFHVGILCGLVNMIIYGLLPVASKLFMRGCDPLLFSGIATLFGSVPLLVILAAKGRLKEIYTGRHVGYLLGIAIISAIATGLFFVGTSLTTAINTGLLEQIEPVYAIILGAIFLGERLNMRQFIATLVMVSGAVVVVYRGFDNFNPGDVMILVAPFFFQCSHLLAKKVFNKVSHVYVIPAARMLYGGVLMSAVALLFDPSAAIFLTSPADLGLIAVFALIFRSLDMILWYEALWRAPLSLLSGLLPIGAGVGFVAAVFLLGEEAGLQQFMGLALIMIGLGMLLLPAKRP